MKYLPPHNFKNIKIFNVKIKIIADTPVICLKWMNNLVYVLHRMNLRRFYNSVPSKLIINIMNHTYVLL